MTLLNDWEKGINKAIRSAQTVLEEISAMFNLENGFICSVWRCKANDGFSPVILKGTFYHASFYF